MRELINIQMRETAPWKWVLLFCLLYATVNISLSSHFASEMTHGPTYEDLLLRVTNNNILATYSYMFLIPIVVGNIGTPSSWQCTLCLRSRSRRMWASSLTIALLIRITVFVGIIIVAVVTIGAINGATFAEQWSQIRSAPQLFSLSPLQMSGISVSLVLARLLVFSQFALLLNVSIPRFRFGILVSILFSCSVDANFPILLPFVPFRLAPQYHTMVSFETGPNLWTPRIGFEWSILYWISCSLVMFFAMDRMAARADFGNQREK